MTTSLHEALLSRGFTLSAQAGKLLVAPAAELTDADRDAIRANRDALLALVDVPTVVDMTTVPVEPKAPPSVLDVPTILARSPQGVSPLADVVALVKNALVLGLDFETTGLDHRINRPRLLSVCDGTRALVLDCWAEEWKALLPYLPGTTLIAHNMAFDAGWLWQAGLTDLPPLLCTWLLAEVLEAGSGNKCGLAPCCDRYLNLPLTKEEQQSDWTTTELRPEQIEYSRKDAAVLPPLVQRLGQLLEQAGLTRIADVECRALPFWIWLCQTGVPFNQPAWETLETRAIGEKLRLNAVLDSQAPDRGEPGLFGALEVWNWDSPQQVKEVLAMLGHPVESSDDEHLALIAHHFAETMRKQREQSQLVKMYGQNWLDKTTIHAGRVFPNWRQIGTETGRTTAKAPNFQQIPRAVAYRNCVEAPPGKAIVKVDYSTVQMRIAARLAGDRALMEVFRTGGDPHTNTARNLLGRQNISKADRQIAKSCIAEGQPVLTRRGLIPIQHVQQKDEVWDGVEWVRHEGVIFQGLREVIDHDGLQATPDHTVYLAEGGYCSFEEAACWGRRLAVTGVAIYPVRHIDVGGGHLAQGKVSEDLRRLFGLPATICSLDRCHHGGLDPKLPVSEEHSFAADTSSKTTTRTLASYPAALYQSAKCILAQLRWQGHRSTIHRFAGVYYMGIGEPAPSNVLGSSNRPHQQRWSLRTRKFAVSLTDRAVEQQTNQLQGALQGGVGMRTSPVALAQERSPQFPVSMGIHSHTGEETGERGGCPQISETKPASSEATTHPRSGHTRLVRVYDIMNAGPRHRFTVAGKLVSNCNFSLTFGSSAEGLRLYAKMTFGIDMTSKEAEGHRNKFFIAYPGLKTWHQRTGKTGNEPTDTRTLLGRRRLGVRRFNDKLNSPVQGDESDGIKQALALLWCTRSAAPSARPILFVHDEITVEVDEGEAAHAVEWLQVSMVEGMKEILDPIPCAVEATTARTWGGGS